MDIETFDAKIKLYCVLKGNDYRNLPKTNGFTEKCIECRKKNNGVCHYSYHHRQIFYEYRNGRIFGIIDSKRALEGKEEKYEALNLEIKNSLQYEYGFVCFGYLTE